LPLNDVKENLQRKCFLCPLQFNSECVEPPRLQNQVYCTLELSNSYANTPLEGEWRIPSQNPKKNTNRYTAVPPALPVLLHHVVEMHYLSLI